MAPLGNLVRLKPLDIREIPPHPALDDLVQNPSSDPASISNERPQIFSFIQEVLDQAVLFVDETLPATFEEKGLNTSPPATAKVTLLSRSVSKAESEAIPWTNAKVPRTQSGTGPKASEAWFARRSRHANHSDEGTADLNEFGYGLRYDHSNHEREYTPTVFDAYKVLDWSEQIRSANKDGASIDQFSSLDMSIHEMCHKLPFPCKPRVFSVLIVTAKRGRHAFIIVQIPIDIRNLAAAFYSNGRNVTEGDSSLKRQKTVLGIYTSIESCSMLPDRNIEWIMATASNAKGWLPMWAQKLGTPGAIIKDVGYFLGWAKKKRPNLRERSIAEDGTPE